MLSYNGSFVAWIDDYVLFLSRNWIASFLSSHVLYGFIQRGNYFPNVFTTFSFFPDKNVGFTAFDMSGQGRYRNLWEVSQAPRLAAHSEICPQIEEQQTQKSLWLNFRKSRKSCLKLTGILKRNFKDQLIAQKELQTYFSLLATK